MVCFEKPGNFLLRKLIKIFSTSKEYGFLYIDFENFGTHAFRVHLDFFEDFFSL